MIVCSEIQSVSYTVDLLCRPTLCYGDIFWSPWEKRLTNHSWCFWQSENAESALWWVGLGDRTYRLYSIKIIMSTHKTCVHLCVCAWASTPNNHLMFLVIENKSRTSSKWKGTAGLIEVHFTLTLYCTWPMAHLTLSYGVKYICLLGKYKIYLIAWPFSS